MDFWQYLQTTFLIVYNKFVFKHLPYVPECRAALIWDDRTKINYILRKNILVLNEMTCETN